MPHFTKPAEGSGPSTIPSSAPSRCRIADSTSPEFYELERDAIFGRTWLNVGRVEQLPKAGSYFTKELDAARTSIVVVRASTDEMRAFHNICRHRGNKLVWQDYPERGDERRMPPVHLQVPRLALLPRGRAEVRAAGIGVLRPRQGRLSARVGAGRGLGGVHLREPRPSNTTPLREYLGELGKGLEGYPFHEMTQVHKYRAEVGDNWKLFIDAFTEFYHAPVLHAKQSVARNRRSSSATATRHSPTSSTVPHGMVSSWGGMSPPKDLNMVKPIERVLRSGLFGPWDAPDIGLDELPPGLNPSSHKAWGLDSFVFFPNFMLLIWKPNWVLTYHYWPTSYNTHIFEGTLLLRAAQERPRTPRAGAGGRHVQGVRTPGRQHARSDPDDARVAHAGEDVPAERPGDPAAPSPSHGAAATSPTFEGQAHPTPAGA